jgi:hypothetical protein
MIKDSHDGKILVIFKPWLVTPDKAMSLLRKYDLIFKKENCTIETGYLGARQAHFMFCWAQRTSSFTASSYAPFLKK